MDADTIIEQDSPTVLMREQELLRNAEVHVYKKCGSHQLELHMIRPDDEHLSSDHPAILFFHSGKWDHQMLSQFVPQALHFALRGAICIIVEYRVSALHYTSPLEAMEDAQDAILWVRENHKHLHIDPTKIIAHGAGSGAHLALCAAMLPDVANDGFYDSRPNALVLYSAIVDTTKKGVGFEKFPSPRDAKNSSPNRFIRSDLPPAIFYHGTADMTTSAATVEAFCKKMRRKKNKCIYYPFQRGTHSFFNFNVNQQNFVQSLESADGFLSELGFLEEDPDRIV